ncbi:MAG: hypothetical protein UU09_C0038G0009 [Microgenomates group bacterium GW2011_GWA2_40_6]|nr:MAG: hypothetical protein UU09_C0038G0009 [Microgenomates group bacterium GW2011_GWA2_40_6]
MFRIYTPEEIRIELAVINAQTEVLKLVGEQLVVARTGQETGRFSFGKLAIDDIVKENPRVKAATAALVGRINRETEMQEEINKGLRAQHSLLVLGEFARKLTGQD